LSAAGAPQSGGKGKLPALDSLPIVFAQQHDHGRVWNAEIRPRSEAKGQHFAERAHRSGDLDEANLRQILGEKHRLRRGVLLAVGLCELLRDIGDRLCCHEVQHITCLGTRPAAGSSLLAHSGTRRETSNQDRDQLFCQALQFLRLPIQYRQDAAYRLRGAGFQSQQERGGRSSKS
jgi:hypothetical protein